MVYKIVAVLLALTMMAPVGGAAERISRSGGTGADAAEAGGMQKSAPAATSAQAKAPEPLSAEEDESLSARTEEPGPEVAGGALSNLHLTYVVIALAAIVLVLIAK